MVWLLLGKDSGENGGLVSLSKPNVVFAAECNGMGMSALHSIRVFYFFLLFLDRSLPTLSTCSVGK